MNSEKLLITFTSNKTNETFKIYGNYEVTFNTEVNLMPNNNAKLTKYKYLDFDKLRVSKIQDETEIPYTSNKVFWNGKKYDSEDMLYSILHSKILEDNTYNISSIDPNLQQYIDSFHTKEKIININNTKLFKTLPSYDLHDLYQLSLATNNFTYYVHEDMMLMLDTDTHEILSDNYFAEEGFWSSIKNIESGDEQVLWNNLPNDVLSIHNNLQEKEIKKSNKSHEIEL